MPTSAQIGRKRYYYKSAKTDDKEDSKKEGEIKVSKLRAKLISHLIKGRQKQILRMQKRGNLLVITFVRVCKFSVFEHRIETRILKKTEENKMVCGEIGTQIRVHPAKSRDTMMIDGNITADSPSHDECKTQNTDELETPKELNASVSVAVSTHRQCLGRSGGRRLDYRLKENLY